MMAINGRSRATGRPALRITRVGAIVAAACMVGTLAACGSSDTASSEGKAPALPEKVDSIAAMVPDSIAEKGTMVVAAGVYPPAVIEPVDGGTPTGWAIENARPIAVGEIYITPERTKSVTFVANHESTDALLVPADSDIESADSKDDLCGLTLAAQLGSAEAALIEKVARECGAN
jgi:polar amino acid transport system substrate-binding protein